MEEFLSWRERRKSLRNELAKLAIEYRGLANRLESAPNRIWFPLTVHPGGKVQPPDTQLVDPETFPSIQRVRDVVLEYQRALAEERRAYDQLSPQAKAEIEAPPRE